MGARGQVPARSDRRRRKNKPDTPIERVEADGEVVIPPAEEDWHPTARAWYESLRESGQSRFYESSDWWQAHFCASLMHQSLTGEKVNAQLVAQIRGLMTDLLSSEASRRRVGLEIVRGGSLDAEAVSAAGVTNLAARRKRLSDAS
jgi:hypothetical protein